VIRRFIDWFTEFGIPVGGVVVNMKIDDSTASDQSPAFVRNRVTMQNSYMQEIADSFGGLVRVIVPLYETEVRGVKMLERVADVVFAKHQVTA
jgi:arsenite-transporting ATPase